MKYNLYQLVLANQSEIVKVSNDDTVFLNKKLEIIEREIVKEYLAEQNGKLGIKNLGNKLRYNTILNGIFGIVKDNAVIVKMTENRRSFIKIFIDSYHIYKNGSIYFFILEDDFGNKSNLVDKSFIRINEIVQELSIFFKCFNIIGKGPEVFFIEMKGFDDFQLYNIEGFTKIELTT